MKCPAKNYLSAFSLLELMVVIAILVLISAFAVPALTSLSGSSGLSSGGRIVANLLTVARSEAINRHTSVRFEVATTWPSDATQAYRKIALVQHDFVANTDTQMTGWQTLPAGVVINPASTGNYFFAVSQSQSPQLNIGGQAIISKYLEFTPTGAPNVNPANSPVQILVNQGYTSGAAASVVRSADYYEIDVDALVGKTQVVRP